MNRAATIVLVMLAGCAAATMRAPFPHASGTIAVIARNQTGDTLAVTGASLLEHALGARRTTVTDVLVEEAETLLRERGYRIHAPRSHATESGAEDAICTLVIAVRRWEPDAPTQPAFVIVGVSASLVDANGRELWSVQPPVHPIGTPGSVTLGDAYAVAARKIVAEILR